MVLGAVSSSKWHSTASWAFNFRSSHESPCMMMSYPIAAA